MVRSLYVSIKNISEVKKENILIKILVKAPNTFYHINHILIDTAVFDKSFAESLADTVIAKIRSGRTTFAAQASIYSADYESAAKGGDLGWFVQGVMLPELDKAMIKQKKGETVF